MATRPASLETAALPIGVWRYIESLESQVSAIHTVQRENDHARNRIAKIPDMLIEQLQWVRSLPKDSIYGEIQDRMEHINQHRKHFGT